MSHLHRLYPLLLMLALPSFAFAQSHDDQLPHLLSRIAALEARVRSLEAERARSHAASPGEPVSDPAFVAEVLVIVKKTPSQSLIDAAIVNRENAATLLTDALQIERGPITDRKAAGMLASKRREDARALHEEADRLEKEAHSPRHLILGWDGTRFVWLNTTSDLSGVLAPVNVGDFLSWRGKLISTNVEEKELAVDAVARRERPDGFRALPPDRRPPSSAESRERKGAGPPANHTP